MFLVHNVFHTVSCVSNLLAWLTLIKSRKSKQPAQNIFNWDNPLKDQLCCCALTVVSVAKQKEVTCQNKIAGRKEGRTCF